MEFKKSKLSTVHYSFIFLTESFFSNNLIYTCTHTYVHIFILFVSLETLATFSIRTEFAERERPNMPSETAKFA